MGGQISLTYTSLDPSDAASLWLLDSGGVWSAAKSERQKDPGSRQTQSPLYRGARLAYNAQTR